MKPWKRLVTDASPELVDGDVFLFAGSRRARTYQKKDASKPIGAARNLSGSEVRYRAVRKRFLG